MQVDVAAYDVLGHARTKGTTRSGLLWGSMTNEELVSLVSSVLESVLSVATISGGVYFFWKSTRKGAMPPEYVAAIVFLILFMGTMIFLFTHLVK
jgi:hypothetical protein